VLEEGSVGSHAAVVARALAIPLVINAGRITSEALNGDPILVDGDQGVVHLRPEETVAAPSATRSPCRPRRKNAMPACATCPRRRSAARRSPAHECGADGRPAQP
jgi:phosphotransferase system enzyme I (PtsP)